MKAKYAVRALSALASGDGLRLQARMLAERSGTPEKFLEAILVELRDAGLVDSRRGPAGGHALARPADAISLGDVIRVIDGPLAPVRCASVTAYHACPECADPDACRLRAVMREARDALAGVLDRVTRAGACRWMPKRDGAHRITIGRGQHPRVAMTRRKAGVVQAGPGVLQHAAAGSSGRRVRSIDRVERAAGAVATALPCSRVPGRRQCLGYQGTLRAARVGALEIDDAAFPLFVDPPPARAARAPGWWASTGT